MHLFSRSDDRSSAFMTLVVMAILSVSIRNANAFHGQSSLVTTPSRLREPLTHLHVSLSSSHGGNLTDTYPDPEHRQSDQAIKRASIQVVPMNNKEPLLSKTGNGNGNDNSSYDDFVKFLKNLSFKVKNPKLRADIMDDELKRLETKYYQLNKQDGKYGDLRCTSEASDRSYSGPLIRPRAKAYAMVINAYSKSHTGKRGAQLAEQVAHRYERFNPGQSSNSFMIQGIIKSWLVVSDFKKAKSWLSKLGDVFAASSVPEYLPGESPYTLYLEALAKIKKASDGHNEDFSSEGFEILKKMRKGYVSTGLPQWMPSNRTYVAALRCQESNSNGMVVVNNMQKIIAQQEEDYIIFGNPESCKPTAANTLPLFAFASKLRGNLLAIEAMETTISHLQQQFIQTKDEDFRPIDQMYSLLFSAYAKVRTKYASNYTNKVDVMLEEMRMNGLSPSIYAITGAIRAKVNTRSDKSLQEAEMLLRSVDNVDAFAYHSLINGYCRNGNAEKADMILRELAEKHGADVISMGVCINAWSKTTDCYDTAIERSENLLNCILDKYKHGLVRQDEKQAGVWVFEDIARLWIQSRKQGAGDKILKLLDKMDEMKAVSRQNFSHTQNLFILAFDALAAAKTSNGQDTLQTFARYQDLADCGALPRPTIRMLSSVLVPLTKQNGPDFSNDAIRVYQNILEEVGAQKSRQKVEARTLTTVFRSLARSSQPQFAETTMQVLRNTTAMARRYPHQVSPNTIVFNACLSGFADRDLPDETWAIFQLMKELSAEGFATAPDVGSYTSIAKSLISVKTPDSLDRLNALTNDIMREYKAGNINPNIGLFNSILTGYKINWSLHADAPMYAHDLLMELEELGIKNSDLAPNALSYRTVCESFSKSKLQGSVSFVDTIFNKVSSLKANGKIEDVDPQLCDAAIAAYTRPSNMQYLEKAEAILNEMEKSRVREKTPDTRTYNRFLFAYARSGEANSAAKAAELFKKMQHAYVSGNGHCMPNVHSFNSLILAAAKSNPGSKTQVFKVAIASFRAMHNKEDTPEPNSATYEYFLRACSRLLPRGEVQKKLFRQVFHLSKERGLVSPNTIKQLYRLLPDVIEMLEHAPRFGTLAEKHESQDDSRLHRIIPKNWSHAVPNNDGLHKVELVQDHDHHKF